VGGCSLRVAFAGPLTSLARARVNLGGGCGENSVIYAATRAYGVGMSWTELGRDGTRLGSGFFGSEEWELVYTLDVPKHPEDDSAAGTVVLRTRNGACGHGPPLQLSEPLGVPSGMSFSHSPPFWLFGEVAAEFDAVRIACENGTVVDAVIVSCNGRFGYNYQVARLPDRPVEMTASTPDGERFTKALAGWGQPQPQ
jgi:hypothetical protein